MPAYSEGTLLAAGVRRLAAAGVAAADATVVVQHMLTADRWGRHTHGISVRFPMILRQAAAGAG